MRFIGDIHGDVLNYASIVSRCDTSVQVGDFGIGFLNPDIYDYVDRMCDDGRHRFIRGNHDDPSLCKERRGWIPDGTVEDGVMFVGGAWTIDWKRRTPGLDWWCDEELSTNEFVALHADYVYQRPRVMVTHDCPTSVALDLFITPHGKNHYETRTANAFEEMFQQHQPDTWIFGHWHEDIDVRINGTRFICLGINSYVDLEV